VEERRRNGDIQLEVLTERVNNVRSQINKSEELSLEWRGKFCSKIDDLKTMINTLPCPARAEMHKGIKSQLIWMWSILGIMLTAVVGEWLKK
jgi:hypothetical protein